MVAAAAATAATAAAAWWLTDSAPYPYAQRALLDLPQPFLSNRRLDALLGARPGERMLEIGPGTGLQALHVARVLGDAGRLEASFDAAYLVTALGEIPDPPAVLRELRRVLRPSGRVVIGKFFDRHYVPLVTLLGEAAAAGLRPTVRLGPPFAYFARLQPDASDVIVNGDARS